MNLKRKILFVSLILFASYSSAQDGESLFKTKCNVCHILDKDGTGPNLKGVKQKWTEAGEGELIYDWVKNSQNLITSGNSSMAISANAYSATAMTPQDVNNEEIDAIFDFIENYTPPLPIIEPKDDLADGSNVTYVPNYKTNINLFYLLIVALGIQFIAILVLSGSIKTIIKLHRLKNTPKTILAIIGIFGTISTYNQSMAMTFMQPGMAKENLPWLLVENSDLIILSIINIVVLLIVIHFRNLFMDVLHSIRPEKVVKRSRRKKKKMNQVLNDYVPIEEEHTILLHHEYDGIKELDNNLPPWWVAMFYGTIIFAISYIFIYHILGTGDLQIAEYEREMRTEQALVDKYLEDQGMQMDEFSATLMIENSDISTGKTLFDINCVLCHNANGEGNIGPNLTDNAWIYGFDMENVYATIKYGTTKGMPEQSAKLNPIQIQQVASYVLTMPEKDGKAAEGTIIEK